jgi:uncharacterized Zn ribbon protein
MKDIRYQEQCASCDCDIWIRDGVRHVICPHCGAKLNEYSSEDASDGELQTTLNHKWDVVKPSEGEIDYDNLPF